MTAWYIIEGQREDESWFGLYCIRREIEAKAIMRLIKVVDANGCTDRQQKRELQLLEEFYDFRIRVDNSEDSLKQSKARATRRTKSGQLLEPRVSCPECGKKKLKRVKRGSKKLWRCLNCDHRFARQP